jgi:hypothetical protein
MHIAQSRPNPRQNGARSFQLRSQGGACEEAGRAVDGEQSWKLCGPVLVRAILNRRAFRRKSRWNTTPIADRIDLIPTPSISVFTHGTIRRLAAVYRP